MAIGTNLPVVRISLVAVLQWPWDRQLGAISTKKGGSPYESYELTANYFLLLMSSN